jgi:hypothetical protein
MNSPFLTQGPVGGVEKSVCSHVVLWFDPFSLQYSQYLQGLAFLVVTLIRGVAAL